MRSIWLLSILVLFFSSYSYSATKLDNADFQQLKKAAAMEEGDLLYIDFWASWCVPCRRSFPWMNNMQVKYASHGLKVLAINLDAERSEANAFLEKLPPNFPIFFDSESRFAKLFKVPGMPASYLVNDKGEIISSHKGFFQKKVSLYEQEIQSFLNN